MKLWEENKIWRLTQERAENVFNHYVNQWTEKKNWFSSRELQVAEINLLPFKSYAENSLERTGYKKPRDICKTEEDFLESDSDLHTMDETELVSEESEESLDVYTGDDLI